MRPDSCSNDNMFFITINNNDNQSHDVTLSMFEGEKEILYQEMSLAENSPSTSSDAEDVRMAGCVSKSYTLEINVSGRESIERTISPESDGYVSIKIQPDETFAGFRELD